MMESLTKIRNKKQNLNLIISLLPTLEEINVELWLKEQIEFPYIKPGMPCDPGEEDSLWRLKRQAVNTFRSGKLRHLGFEMIIWSGELKHQYIYKGGSRTAFEKK